MLGDVRLLDHAAHEQVAEEVALVLVLDGADRALPGDEQRRDDGHPLERVHVLLGHRLAEPQAHQPGQVGAAGGDPQAAHLAAVERQPGLPHPLDAQPAGGVDEAGAGQRLPLVVGEHRGALAAVGRRERHPDAEHGGRLGGDLLEVTALQHDVAQRGVQRVDPRQHVGGGVSGYQHLGPIVGDRWHNLTAAKSNGAR